jgi:hypothetical protein
MSTPMTAARRWAGATLAAALIAAGLQAVPAAAAARPAAAATGAPGPVSNAFAMGGGLGGQIDPRTGAFQASEPLVTLGDRGGDGLSLALSYDQSAAALGPAGTGSGWVRAGAWACRGWIRRAGYTCTPPPAARTPTTPARQPGWRSTRCGI